MCAGPLVYPAVTHNLVGAGRPAPATRIGQESASPLTTHDLAAPNRRDEHDMTVLNSRFVEIFHRLPSDEELVRFRRGEAPLHLRLQRQTRRSLARLILAC